jgi:hypothetical protein
MKKEGFKMWYIIGILLLIVGIIIFLSIPFSPTITEFNSILDRKIKEANGLSPEVFTEKDIHMLPLPVQRYFHYCGYLGTPKMNYMRASFKDVDFIMSPTRTIKIDYQQLNLVSKPERFALITSSLYGIPFEGLDSYQDGKGSMKGRLAKVITLFDQQGENMDRSSLVTWLSECLLVPSAALKDFLIWESIDDVNARATITWDGITVSGIFTFSPEGELLSFRTSDRVAVDMKGEATRADWSGYFQDYYSVNGILQPKIMKSVWHYHSGDSVYFNQNESPVSIRYQ